MGRQLNVTEDRSLREIHGCPCESAPPPPASYDGKRRSRSSPRQKSRSPPRTTWGPERGFGNIWSPVLGPLSDFHKRRDERSPPKEQHLAAVNASGGWQVLATTATRTTTGVPFNALASVSEKGNGGTKTASAQLSHSSTHSAALPALTSSKASDGMMGDTIVGVSNGGAYTIGPLYSRTVQEERQTEQRRRGRRRKRKGKAVVIPLFMAASLVYFIATMYINNCPGVGRGCTLHFLRRMSFQPLKENPLLGPTSSTLLAVGAVDAVLTSRGKAGWRLVTSLWLPAGLFHLLLLLLGMLCVGIRFEQDFGWLCATLVFLIPGIGGSLLTALLYTDVASAGASSGALLGVLGARLAEMAATNVSASGAGKRRWVAAGWCAATMGGCVCAGVMPNVGNVAHLGGCLAGFLLALVFLVRPHMWRTPSTAYDPDDCLMSRKQSVWHWALWALALALLLAAYAGLAVALFTRTRRSHASCSTSVCHHLSCVPTRLWNCSSPTNT